VDEQDYEHVVRFPAHVWQHVHAMAARVAVHVWQLCGTMLAAWWQVLPVAIEHGVRDMPHALMLLSICKHVLGLRGSVAQASLLDELGLQPLQII
jgi:hypothetical protein